MVLSIGLATGCERAQIELVDPLQEANTAEQVLATASREYGESQKRADDYAKFTAALQPHLAQLSGRNRQTAEANLYFFAIPPSLDALNSTPELHVNQMAATVWPTILQLAIESGESPADYAERLCQSEWRDECQPRSKTEQTRFVVVHAMQTLKHRAELAYRRCPECQDKPSYRTQLSKLNVALIDVQSKRRIPNKSLVDATR